MLLRGKMVAVLVISLVLLMTVGIAEEERKDATGQWAYTVNADGATVTIVKYEGPEVVQVDVPCEMDGFRVTAIGDYAFDRCHETTHITLPDSVTAISGYAFTYPPSIDWLGYLESIEVAPGNPVYASVDGVLYDRKADMLHTYPLKKEGITYRVPDGITAIGANAFKGCHALQIILPDSLTSIGEEAFYLSDLPVIKIPANVTHIAQGAFAFSYISAIDVDPENPVYASVDGVLIDRIADMLHTYPRGNPGTDRDATYAVPEGIVSIANRAFYVCASLEQVTLPDSLTHIGDEAFSSCYSLSWINLPDSLVSIGTDAFCACRVLPGIRIPAGVTHIGAGAFYAYSLSSIEVAPGNPVYASVDGVLFDRKAGMLHTYPQAKEGEAYTVPEGIVAIEEGAFGLCRFLTQITLPDSLAAIGAYGLYDELTVYGSAGSFAQRYAEENGMRFVPLDSAAETAETYTHPRNIYSFHIPQGWVAIDGENAKALLALGLDVVEYRDLALVDMTGEAPEEGTVVMLYEVEKADGQQRNYINFGYMELGQEIPVPDILAQEDNFVLYMQTIYEAYRTTAPIAAATFGEREAAVMSGEYTLNGQTYAIRQAIVSIGDNLFTATLSTSADQIAGYETVLADVLSSLTTPGTAAGISGKDQAHQKEEGFICAGRL